MNIASGPRRKPAEAKVKEEREKRRRGIRVRRQGRILPHRHRGKAPPLPCRRLPELIPWPSRTPFQRGLILWPFRPPPDGADSTTVLPRAAADSLAAGTDSLHAADSLSAGADSLAVGADSLSVGADSLAVAADSLAVPPDTTR